MALEHAVSTAVLADPTIGETPEALVDFLRSLPDGFRLLAAIDDEGMVRATSGAGVFAGQATVIFVNTDPGWRRRGIGQAMTAVALHAAVARGARQACLDASAAGRSIYLRLGFEPVTAATQFRRAPTASAR